MGFIIFWLGKWPNLIQYIFYLNQNTVQQASYTPQKPAFVAHQNSMRQSVFFYLTMRVL